MAAISEISTALDKDAEYVLRRIAQATQHTINARRHREDSASERRLAEAVRIEAGKRLIEVKESFSHEKVFMGKRVVSAFTAWYQGNGLKTTTVYRYMELAGYTEKERDTERRKTARYLHKNYVKRKREALRPITYDEAVGPLVLALNELNRQIHNDPADQVVARLQKSYAQGDGLDRGFVTTLSTMRDWFDEVIKGAQPLVVQCG